MKHNKIIIRADGNARIGAGHLMRCLTIADAIGDKSSVMFVCADEDSASLARESGYAAYVLHTDYTDMEAELPLWADMMQGNMLSRDETPGQKEVFEQKEVSEQTEILEQTADRVILVDSYYMTNPYLEGLGRFGRILVLDDMVKTAWNAEAVINYNAFANQEMYDALNSPYKTEYYTGGKYIPIRREFCSASVNKNACADNGSSKDGGSSTDTSEPGESGAKHILITTGGGDCDNIAGQILERIWSENCHYHIVTGRFNPHYDTLLNLTEVHSNIHIYHDVKNMAELMARCDLAVTAGGTTIYELSALGVPFVCFSYAENQEKLTEYIGKNRIAGYGGRFHKDQEKTLEAIKTQIAELIDNEELCRAYAQAEQKLVDGQGAVRIAEILCGK